MSGKRFYHQRVTLDITFDADEYTDPAAWDFANMLDVPEADVVKLAWDDPEITPRSAAECERIMQEQFDSHCADPKEHPEP